MKKLYEKNELTFAIVWIVVYCVLQSLANPLNKAIGVEYTASAVFGVVQSIVLFAFIRRNNLMKKYGLCKSPAPARRFLYYVPLIILASGNLWNGVVVNHTPMDTACRIVCMFCVGFLLVTIFYRGGSLLPCILVHSAINTLSTFANDADLTTEMHLLHLGNLIVVTVSYTMILTRTLLNRQLARVQGENTDGIKDHTLDDIVG